ncbi:ATP-dependent Clp protease adapter ClpS [Rothia sp. 88186D007BW]
MPSATLSTNTLMDAELDIAFSDQIQPNLPWVVIVWDDPVNLMSFVTYVLRTQFGYSTEKAHQLMMQVHTEGKATVFSGSKEEAERHTTALHTWGLWATIEQAGA